MRRNIFWVVLFLALLAVDPNLSRVWTQYAHVTALTAASAAVDFHARAIKPMLDWAYSGATVTEAVLAYQCRHLGSGGLNCSNLTGTVCEMAERAGLLPLYEEVWGCE